MAKDGRDPARAFPGDRPSATMLCDDLDAATLGALIAFHEHRTFAAAVMTGVSEAAKNAALRAAAAELRARQADLLAANADDLSAAEGKDFNSAFIDRLTLTPERIEAMAKGEASVTMCTPGGNALAREISEKLGVEADLAGLGDGPAGDGPLALTFEVVYGHALKPQPRLPVQGETVLSLDDMRRVLQQGKRDPAQSR